MQGSERVWDIATKLAVPLSIILAGALVTHEVRIAKMETEQSYIRRGIGDDLSEIKILLRDMEQRLREVEKK